MNALILLIIAQLLCLCYGHLNEPEFGRYSIDEGDPRRNRLLVVDNTAKRRRTKQAKQSKADESNLKGAFELRDAMMELSMSFSLSMSMDEPTTPTTPAMPSRPPTPFIPPLPPSGNLPPSGPPGPTGVLPPELPPTGDLPPSGPPGPTPAFPPAFPPTGVLPPSGPTGPTGNDGPLLPSGLPLITSEQPSSAPVQPSEAPQKTTDSPTVAPTENPTATPSYSPSISTMPTGEYDCPKTNVLTLGTAADKNSTPVALDMSYSAESNSSSIEEFEEELVEEFIRTAVLAIFGCIPDTTGKIAPNTVEIIDASCDPTVDLDNECFVMQTTFIIGVEGPVDTDVAAYDVYKSIQEGMEQGNYTEVVDQVDFLEFLSPSPLIPPPSPSGDSTPVGADDGDLQRDVDVSPWTIGFSVASVMGGFVSLLVYARTRRRSRQNADREETTPWVNPETETVL